MARDGEYSVKRVMKDLSKASPPKQLAIGAGTGWLVGYTTMKLGKAVATTIGGTILLLQARYETKFTEEIVTHSRI